MAKVRTTIRGHLWIASSCNYTWKIHTHLNARIHECVTPAYAGVETTLKARLEAAATNAAMTAGGVLAVSGARGRLHQVLN